jgi:cation diffusion facilitator CzcD-associated flavoprotein CzcO
LTAGLCAGGRDVLKFRSKHSNEREEHVAESTDVVVVGAGPAGLAVGACLKKAGLDFIILEKESQVASSWRRHYERLHLHTVKQFSSLPFVPFPSDYPRYVPRNLFIQYLDSYAAQFGLQPRFGATVRAIRREGDDWLIESTSSSIRARNVVIASGYNTEPTTPPVPGIEKFKGKVIHSAQYANAKSFAGQSVLVIGMGNTGAEIALDLAENGARPTISLRNGVHIVPRDLFGVPIQMVAMLATKVLPVAANDKLFPIILDAALGNLTKYGIRRPPQGLLQQIRSSAKIPVLDVGTVRKISEGAIKIAPGLSAVTENGVIFNGGSEGRFDAIIFATGYRANYQSFIAADAAKSEPGLYFVGYRNSVTGLLREISKEAMAAADEIRSRQNAGAAAA